MKSIRVILKIFAQVGEKLNVIDEEQQCTRSSLGSVLSSAALTAMYLLRSGVNYSTLDCVHT